MSLERRVTVRPAAYSFELDDSMGALQERLNRVGPWQWSLGDSAWHGDYLGARPLPHAGVVRIYGEGHRFVLVVKHGPEAPSDADALHAELLGTFLPSIGARNVAPHDGVD